MNKNHTKLKINLGVISTVWRCSGNITLFQWKIILEFTFCLNNDIQWNILIKINRYIKYR